MNDQNDHDFTGGDLKAAVTGWTPNRRRFLSVAGLAVGGAVVGTTAAGCGTAQTGNTLQCRILHAARALEHPDDTAIYCQGVFGGAPCKD